MPNGRDYVQVRRPGTTHQYQAPSMRLGRSQFGLVHQHKTTFDAGNLIPYFVTEVLPGDTFTCRMLAFLRVFSPLDAPIMDNIEASIDFFFVPNRLVWDNWENFLGAHDDAGAQDTTYTIPRIGNGITVTASQMAHYMGLPVSASTSDNDISALPFRAAALIYNEYYRDQNLIDSKTVNTDNGPDTTNTHFNVLFKSAKKHDYFTSALPYLQKGTAQTIPLTDAPVAYDLAAGNIVSIYSENVSDYIRMDADAAWVDSSSTLGTSASRLYADLSNVGLTVNALREAAAVQRLLERDARGGTRHPELIRAHFGVDVPDYRTQRPEYLGGGRGYINTSPVANTSGDGTFTQGQLAGTAAGTLSASWAKSFVEHGHIIGFLRARGDVSYQQGIDRMWSRSTRYDFMWPELAMLGEQAILNKELYIQGTSADDDVFGYQERYAEYRYKKSLVTGKFDSNATGSLDYWHLAEDFGSAPALNSTFIEDATPMARVVTVTTEPDFIVDGRFDLRVARALPVRPVPTLAPARF